jgi:hypothetical protein
MSHNRGDYRKKEIKLQKWCFFVYIHIGFIVYVEEKVRKYAFKVL